MITSWVWNASTATVLIAGPQDMTVEANQWAQLNCTVDCDYTVGWYMAGHSIAIKRNNTVPGLYASHAFMQRPVLYSDLRHCCELQILAGEELLFI